MKNILSIIFFFLLSNISFSQNEIQKQRIYLTDGSILKGQILTTDENAETVEIQLDSGAKMSVPKNTIVKTKEQKRLFESLKNGVAVQNKGLYLLPQVYLLSAKRAKIWEEDPDDIRHFVGGSFTAGYQFFQYLAVGAGVGLNLYETALVPAFLDVRGNLTKSNPTVFYALNGGYGFRTGDWLGSDNELVEYSGGYFYYPSIGLKLNTRNNVSFQIDVGYNIQHQERTFESPWDGQTTVDKIVYRSLAIRAGVSF